jgi:selenocysteine-specific elongation factor
VVARAGDRFVIRSYSPVHTIAGGTVAEPVAPRRKRLEPDTVEFLRRVAFGPERVSAVVALAGRAGTPAAGLPVSTGLPPAELADLPGDVCSAGDRLYPASLAAEADQIILAALEARQFAHPLEPGMSREELRRAAGGIPAQLLDRCLTQLLADERVSATGAAFCLTGFEPAMNARQQHLAGLLLATLSEARLAAPRLPELPPALRDDPDLPAVARHLVRQGSVIALAHDHLADPHALRAAARALAASFGEQPRQSASRLKEVLGVTRKHLIPVLEYFDRVGVTRRDGDERVAGPALRGTSGEDT